MVGAGNGLAVVRHGFRRRDTVRLVRWLVAVLPFLLIVLVVGGGIVLGRRRGYDMGGAVVVRCKDGHLFTTIWIPGASLKAIRLGWYRLQRCPVGDHWTIVTPVRDEHLTDEERRSAGRYTDDWIP